MGAIYGELSLDWQAPIAQEEFARGVAKLAHRANAGSSAIFAPGAALSWSNAGTPNDALLLEQPWQDHQLWIAFDGRLHNRTALCKLLALPESARVSTILVAAWRRFGAGLLDQLAGSFALVVIDFASRELLLARDLLGGRALHFCTLAATARSPAKIIFASEEQALTQLDSRPSELAIANYFAFKQMPTVIGNFEHTRTVPAGSGVHWIDQAEHFVSQDFTLPSPARRWKERDTADAAAEFRSLLDQSVGLYLPDAQSQISNRLAISLSGGLDSNALFASAAGMLAPERLTAVTWQFKHLPQCDESHFATAHAAQRGVSMQLFAADALHAFSNSSTAPRPVSLSTPASNIYRELKTQAYAAAAQFGARTFFNGGFGDHLFPDPSEWLCDALSQRDFGAITRETRWLAQSGRTHAGATLGGAAGQSTLAYFFRGIFWREPGFRRLARRALGREIYGCFGPEELTEHARRLCVLGAAPKTGFGNGLRAWQTRLSFGTGAAFGASGEAEFAERFSIDACTPLRSVSLLQFMLTLPISFSYRCGASKWLVREALRGTLPEAIRTRPKSTSLQPFFDAALDGAARAHAESLLFHPDADWPRFYDAKKIRALLAQTQRSDAQSARIWQCLSYETWRAARGLR